MVANVYIAEDPTSTVSSTTAINTLQSLVNSNNPSVTQGKYPISKLVTTSTSTTTSGGGANTPFISQWYFYLIIVTVGAALVAVVVIIIVAVMRRNRSNEVGYEYFKTNLEEGLLAGAEDFEHLYRQYENQPNSTLRKQKHDFIPLQNF